MGFENVSDEGGSAWGELIFSNFSIVVFYAGLAVIRVHPKVEKVAYAPIEIDWSKCVNLSSLDPVGVKFTHFDESMSIGAKVEPSDN